MVTRIGGKRRKTRHKFAKPIRTKGKISLKNYFQTFNAGDRVYLKAEPAVHEGFYDSRFHGKSGLIDSIQGTCYRVIVKDGSKAKTIIVHPVHLKKA